MTFFVKTLLIAAVLTVSACGGAKVQTRFDTYSSIKNLLEYKGKRAVVVPAESANLNALEFAAQKKVLERILTEKGFVVVGDERQSDYVARLSYDVGSPEKVSRNYSVPHYGLSKHGSASISSRRGGFNSSFGVTGHRLRTSTWVEFNRSAEIVLFKRGSDTPVFEGKGISFGSCHAFGPVAEPMFRGILSNFPLESSGRVTLPMDSEC